MPDLDEWIEKCERWQEADEEMRKDAARYRWMAADPRSRASWEFCDTKEEMDSRIDEAMDREC